MASIWKSIRPTHEAEIHQPSAWSCPHGVDRWRRDCGCNSGGHGGWNQDWREPLRNAIDWLRDQLAPRYEAKRGGVAQGPVGRPRRIYQRHSRPLAGKHRPFFQHAMPRAT